MKSNRATKLLSEERGESMVSYVLLVALIAIICVPSANGISYGFRKNACILHFDGPEMLAESWDGHCWESGESRGYGDYLF